MLKMKGMIAKLFSAVLALGMVIQPVTPLTSPIVVFAQDEEVDPNPDTTPAPRSTPDPGAGEGNLPDPGEGNTPETTPEPTPGETGGEQTPTVSLPETDGDYLIITEDANSKGKFIISLAQPEGEQNTFDIDYFFGNYDVSLTANVLVQNPDGKKNDELSKTDASVVFAYDAETETATVDVNSLTEGLRGYYVTVNGLGVTYTPKADQDKYEVNVFGESGKSAIASWENKYELRETSAEIADYDKENKSISATVTNPKVGVQYKLQIFNAEDSELVTSEPVSVQGITSSVTVSLSDITDQTCPGKCSIVVVEDAIAIKRRENVSFDYTQPQLTNLSVDKSDENTDKVVAEFNEEMDASSLKLVLNYENNTVRSSGTVEVTGFAKEGDVGHKYSASLANLGNENSETTTATKYTFKSLTGVDASGNNNSLVYAEGSNPSKAFENYVVDDKAPIVTDIQWSDNVNTNVEANQDVKVTVTFSEPLVGDPELLYTVDDSDSSNPYKITGTFNTEEGNYTFTFVGSKDENKPAGEKYSVIGYNAIDAEGNSKHDEEADAKVSKDFIIDMIAPTVSANFVYPSDNKYTDGEGNNYYNSFVKVEIVANEQITGTLTYNKDTSEEPVSVSLPNPQYDDTTGNYTYIVKVDSQNGYSDIFSDFVLNDIKDLAGNDPESNTDALETAVFGIDYKTPMGKISSSSIDGDSYAQSATFEFEVEDGNGAGVKSGSFELRYDGNNTPISADNIKSRVEEGKTIYSVTLNSIQASSAILAKFTDNLGNVTARPVEVPISTVVEDTEPVVTIEAIDSEVYSKNHTVQISSEDKKGDVNSGIQSITYKLYEAEGFDDSNLERNTAVVDDTETDVTGDNLLEGNLELTLSQDSNGNLLNGIYYLYVCSTDLCGNVSDYKKVTLNFDNTAPVISDISAPNRETYLNRQNVQFTVADTLAGINEITITLLKDDKAVAFTVVDDTDAVVSDSKNYYTINDLVDIKQYLADFTIDGAADGLDGAYDLQISATDKSAADGNATTRDEIKKVTLKFDNTAPVLEDLSEVENERCGEYTQSKTVKYTVTDEFAGVKTITFKMVDSAGKPVDKFTVVDADGNVLRDSQDTYTVTVDEANQLSVSDVFTIDGTADGLNGDYTLRMTAKDYADNEVAEAKQLDLHFDNTTSVTELFEEDNSDERIGMYDQKQKVNYEVSDTYAGVQTIRFELYSVTEDGLTPADFTVEGSDVSDDFTEIQVEDNDAARSVEGSLIIDGSKDNLNGKYVLKMLATDWAGNVNTGNEIKEVTLFFDNTPMDITVNYISDAGAYEETDGDLTNLYYNQPVEVEVTVKDNFVINGGDENYDGLLFTTTNSDPDGDRHVVADRESDGLDRTEFSASFTFDPQNEKEYFETLKNWYLLKTCDDAGNGSIVTVNYITASGDRRSEITEAEVQSFIPSDRIIVDMVSPKYEIDLGTSGNTYDDVTEVVNKEYFGSAVVQDFKPTVTFTEGNYDANAYQVATVSDISGETLYENVSFAEVPDSEWHSIGEQVNGSYSFLLPEDLNSNDELPDGVYRFAVRGVDKAGNALEPSLAEAEKTDAAATNMVTEGVYWTGYKIVDTQISVKLEIMRNNGNSAYLTYEKDNIGRTNVNIKNPRDLYRQENEAYVKANAVDEKSQYRIEFSVDSTIASYPLFGADQGFGRAEVTTGSYIAGNQRFNVTSGYIVDRAGNRVELNDIGDNNIYLDTLPPTADDIDRPTASIRAKATSDITARTPDGQDLYAGDVRLDFTITDPNQSEAEPTSSGLREVHYVVKADGVEVAGNVLHKSDFNNATTYTWSGYTVVGSDTNNISVELWGIDNSGNESNHATYNFGIDKTAPVITVTYDNNDASHEKYFKANRTATVTIQDRNIDFSKIHVETSVGHSALSSADANGSGVGNNDTRTFTIPYTEDGDYTLEIYGTDAVGNQAAVNYEGTAPREFTIDKTTPVINVSFNNNDVRNGKYYNAARVATVTIDEHNFLADEVTIDQTASIQRGSTGAPSPSGFGTSGDTHTATINYAADGNYTLTVSYTDMAGNEAEQVVVPEFTIDTTKPVVRFDENTVTDNMATNDVIAPSVIFDDTNFDANGINVTLTGARVDNHNHPFTRTVTQFGSVVTFSDFARVKESDDIYTAKATITDLAGNTAEATVRFSVNRFGSTFDFNDDEPTIDLVDSYYAQETGNVIIREVNVNKLTGYTLTVNRDGSNITLVEGEDFRVISSSIAGGYQYIYEIFPDVFTSEGTYSIIVQSVDEAGNTNTNSTVRTDDGINDYPVVFAIDKTLPTVSIDELDPEDRSNNNFNENTKTFRISVRDNNAMSRVVVTVDGNVVFDMEGQELAEYLEEHGGFVEITLDAASGYQTIKVQAFDGAGNESADTQYQVLVTTNFFVRFFYNKPLFYGSIIFLILLLLAIAYYIKKRMDKQKKNA